MKRHTWNALLLKSLFHPVLLVKFLRRPRTYSDLDHWLEIDEQKCEIVAKIIGCNNAESLKAQQKENMSYRQTVATSFEEWMLRSRCPVHAGAIDAIATQYEVRKMCHRHYDGREAGIWCYCK